MGNNPTPPPAGPGRPKGSPNKATLNARVAIGAFIEGNVSRLNGLLDDIEEKHGPKAAWDCIVSVLEYHVPKLGRTELTGKDGEAIEVKTLSGSRAASLERYRQKFLEEQK